MIKKFLRDNPVHKNIVPIFDLFFLLRPPLFFPVWVMITVGMAMAKMQFTEHPIWIVEFDLKVLFMFIGFTFISSSAFILNQIKDIEGDKVNNKLFLVGNKIEVPKAELLMKILFVVGIISLIIAGFWISIIGLFLFLFWGILYNLQPVEGKRKPILGAVINAMAGFLLYLAGWTIVFTNENDGFFTKIGSDLFVTITPYILSFVSVSLLTTIPDRKGDSETDAKTFAVKFGKFPTILIATILVILAFVIAFILGDPISSTATIVAIPFFLVTVFRRKESDVLRTIRYSIFLLTFFVMVVYPWLFPPVFIVFYLSKYYYWHRFNLHYPTFVVESE